MTLQDKKSRMAAIVSDWQASGMSQVEYARVHNFKIGTLRYWITQKRRISGNTGSFIQLASQLVHPATEGSPVIRIRYPHGIELTLPAHTPLQVIQSLIHP